MILLSGPGGLVQSAWAGAVAARKRKNALTNGKQERRHPERPSEELFTPPPKFMKINHQNIAPAVFFFYL
jgi:hypothetical protein